MTIPKIDVAPCSIAKVGGHSGFLQGAAWRLNASSNQSLRLRLPRRLVARRQLAISAAREVAAERRGRHTDPPRDLGKGRAALRQQHAGKVLVLLRERARAPPPPSPLCQRSCRPDRIGKPGSAGRLQWLDMDNPSKTEWWRVCCRQRARRPTSSRVRSASACRRWSDGGRTLSPRPLAGSPAQLASAGQRRHDWRR